MKFNLFFGEINMKILDKPVFMMKSCVENGDYKDRISDAFIKEGKARGFSNRELNKVIRLANKQVDYNGFVSVIKANVIYQ